MTKKPKPNATTKRHRVLTNDGLTHKDEHYPADSVVHLTEDEVNNYREHGIYLSEVADDDPIDGVNGSRNVQDLDLNQLDLDLNPPDDDEAGAQADAEETDPT